MYDSNKERQARYPAGACSKADREHMQDEQYEQDDHDKPEAAAWVVTPVAAVAPRRESANEQQDHDDEKNQTHRELLSEA